MKRQVNKLSKFLMTLAIMLSIIVPIGTNTSVISAATVDNSTSSGYKYTGVAEDGNGNWTTVTNQPIMLLKADGKVAFCIEPWTFVYDGSNYTPSKYDNHQIAKIVYCGYQNTAKTNYDYAVTQLMVWEYFGFTPDSHTVPNYASRKVAINTAISKLTQRPSFHGQTVTLNRGETIVLNDTKEVLSTYSGSIGNLQGVDVKRNGNSLAITATGSAVSGSYAMNKIPPSMVGTSMVYRKTGNQAVATTLINDPVNFALNIRITGGRVKFAKTGDAFTDNDGNSAVQNLTGAELTICARETIKDHSGNVLYDKDEVVEVIKSTNTENYSSYLPEGKYYAYESKSPDGYLVDGTRHNFDITANGGADQTINVDIFNDRIDGRVKFEKTGEVFTHTMLGSTNLGIYEEPMWETKKIPGAELTICARETIKDHSGNVLYDKDEVVDVIESTTNDDYSIWLPEGKYYAYESKAPEGYIEDLTKHKFEISADGGADQTIEIDIFNERADQLLVFSKTLEEHNVDKYQDNNAYRDVVFGIFAREDIKDYNGEETIAPNTMVDQFIIDATGKAKDSVIWDDVNGDGIEQKEELTFKELDLNLPVGKYYVKELQTNWAYNMDTNEYDFEVSYQGANMHNITFTVNDGNEIVNELKDFSIQVNKVDAQTNQPIKSKDFEFGIYADVACTELVEKVNADTSTGTALFDEIHSGEYWIRETNAPQGYMLSGEVKHLVISEDGVFVNDEKIESAEDGIYSFVYQNTLMPTINTGDHSNVSTWVMLLLTSSSLLVAFAIMKHKRKEN